MTNGSFASPVADAQYSPVGALPAGGLLSAVYNGMSAFNLLMTAFTMLVAYDQCEGHFHSVEVDYALISLSCCSHVRLEQRLNCRPCIEDSVHRTFPRVDIS